MCMRCTQDGDAGGEVRVLMKADPALRESLQAEAEIDPMDGEQTWPTESELQEAEGIKEHEYKILARLARPGMMKSRYLMRV